MARGVRYANRSTPCADQFTLFAKTQQCFLRVGRDQHAVLGEDVASAEAAAVRQHRTVLSQQQPSVRAELSMKPDGGRRDRGGETGGVAAVAEPLERAQGGT